MQALCLSLRDIICRRVFMGNNPKKRNGKIENTPKSDKNMTVVTYGFNLY